MLANGGGAIVNTSSGVAFKTFPGQIAYLASKHGVVGITKGAALEFAEKNVRVNAICPGTVLTPLVEAKLGLLYDKDFIREANPMKRFGEPEEIAAAAVWLCSDAASFVNGVAPRRRRHRRGMRSGERKGKGPSLMIDEQGALCIGVDVGGTFTDVVLTDAGETWQGKAPTTPDDLGRGVLDALSAGREPRRYDARVVTTSRAPFRPGHDRGHEHARVARRAQSRAGDHQGIRRSRSACTRPARQRRRVADDATASRRAALHRRRRRTDRSSRCRAHTTRPRSGGRRRDHARRARRRRGACGLVPVVVPQPHARGTGRGT